MKTRLIFLLTLIVLVSPFLTAQMQNPDKNAWVSVSAESALYSTQGACYGGSVALAYGRGVSVGFKAGYFADINNDTDVLELCFLLRYFPGSAIANSGFFVQLQTGQAVFFRREDGLSLPAQWGMFSVGLNAGWRFLLGEMFYFEPFLRGGYPYFIGAGLGAGVRF